MILEFSVTNYKSIKDTQIFSMLPDKKIKEHRDSVLTIENYKALCCSLVYGRNASGKSNLIRAFAALLDLVYQSSKYEINSKIPHYIPFKLDKTLSNKPIEFKIDFIAKDNLRYVYEISYNADTILKESLFFYPKKQIAKLFERYLDQEISYGDYFVGRKKELQESLYKNQLLLSKVGTERIEKLISPYLFFSKYFFVYGVDNHFEDDLLISFYTDRIVDKKHQHFLNNLSKLLKIADTGIESISIKEQKQDMSSLPSEMSSQEKEEILNKYKYKIRTTRHLFDNGKPTKKIDFLLSEESTGTLKLIGIGGLIIEALETGQSLIIDELDKSLHPKLTRALIKIFMSSKTNPNKAQLIFATHDVSLLDLDFFRRDQIWFVEKKYEGNSCFYSVSDLAGVRKNVPLEKWYMSGRLGATPIINETELQFQF